RKPAVGARPNWMLRLLIVAVIFSAAIAVRLSLGLFHRNGGGSVKVRGGTPYAGGHAHPGRHLKLDWAPPVVVGSLLLAGVLIAWAIHAHGKRATPRTKEQIAADLSDVLDDTLDDLRAEADPRRAVIAAYARMERALAWFGLPRQVFEAPLEYLSRVLLDLR